jgi:hypothetical protein
MSPKIIPMALCAVTCAATLALMATAAHADSGERTERAKVALEIAVFGDSPYGVNNADTAQFKATPAFIQAINADKGVSLVLQVGDIHSGKQTCSHAYNQSIYDMWTAFKAPLIYTPGDNEWTDCHKAKEGGLDPLVNLASVRNIFFAAPGQAIGGDMDVTTQATSASAFPSDAEYVENVVFEKAGVVFVTLNIPGGSNNDEDNWYGLPRTPAQTAEVLQRTAADLRWLDKAFALADARRAKAVVIQTQADMWDLDGTAPADQHLAHYRQFIDSIALHTQRFGKPVLLLNGDSHGYRSDNPLMAGAPCLAESGATEVACTDDAYTSHANGYKLPNFHRITVHGSVAPMEWLKLSVRSEGEGQRTTANSFGPFSWERKVQALPAAQ